MLAIRRDNAHQSLQSTIVKSTLMALFVFILVINQPKTAQGNVENTQNATSFPSNFHVFCPISNASQSFLELMSFLDVQDASITSQILKEISAVDTYIVFVRASAEYTNLVNSPLLMTYCGWARQDNETDCSNAKFVCTIPGPIFYLPIGSQVEVIWVNEINATTLSWSAETDSFYNCFNESNPDPNCYQMAKVNANYSDCTFNSPTNLVYNYTKMVRISPQAAPISPHVHGLQNRPTFDGNPWSWFNNAGDRGIGFFTQSTNGYYTMFNESLFFLRNLLSNSQKYKNFKVNSYKNSQSPGFCFYHDHAMRATLFNVMKGLAGFYILYDPIAQANFPSGKYNVYFIFHYHNLGDVRNYSSQYSSGTDNDIYVNPTGDTMFVSKKKSLLRNMTYRYRFINGHFDSFYNNVSFAIFYQTIKDTSGFINYVEVTPPMHSTNFTNFMHQLSFTAIASDGSLHQTPIQNLSQFSLAGGQRFQLLIKFDSVPAQIKTVYVISTDSWFDSTPYVVKLIYNLSDVVGANLFNAPSDFTYIPVNFTNLSLVSKQNIAVNRMRVLFSRPTQVVFSINMHKNFNQGGTQNPKIGTIQDWYIINTISESHPIHFHLISFQAIEEYSLKVISEGCSLFQLDFFRESNITQFQISDNSQLCDFLNNLTSNIMNPLWPIFDTYLLQNLTYSTDLGTVSGKNVMELLNKTPNNLNQNSYLIANCPLGSVYKYICDNTSANIYPWYRRWKDTAEIKKYSVSVLRIRWAQNTYDDSHSSYFDFSEDQLVEFPGFVYHCHILPHEENMMMRPLMLQYSDQYLKNFNSTTSTNACAGLSWFSQFQCINNHFQCPAPTINSSTFYSHVYCPVNNTSNPSFLALVNYLNVSNTSNDYEVLSAAIENFTTYIIFVRAASTNLSPTTNDILLNFCGWARTLNSDCSQAQLVCSIPGPMFSLPTDSEIDVIWVNQINGTGLNWTMQDYQFCYNGDFQNSTEPQSNKYFCNLTAKDNNKSEQCTFYMQNEYINNFTKIFTISQSKAPISIHIHGMQNRPVFDGNPMSWFGIEGDKGPGYQSLSNPLYFTYFNNSIIYTNKSLSKQFTKAIKIIRLKIPSHPGMYFYHDHTFKLTTYDNLKGMLGLFIVFNTAIEQEYPSGNEEIYFILNYYNRDDLRLVQKRPYFHYVSPFGNNHFSDINIQLYRNMTYRFRILNGHFDTYYANLSFSYFCENASTTQGILLEEIEPPIQESSYETFSQNMNFVSLTIIGADSALMNAPIFNVTQINMHTSQRVDVLLKFDQIPKTISKVYVVCNDDGSGYYTVKAIINLRSQAVNNSYKNPSDYGPNSISFFNLSLVSDSQIVLKRMRPIFSRPIQKLFTISMHLTYNTGGVEDPQIGTIQDWYMINTIFYESHPMHIHLINFQVIAEYSLKITPEGCTLYQLDFFRQTNITEFQIANDSQLCNYLQNNISLVDFQPHYTFFSNYHLETEKYMTDIGLVSGKNVMEKYSNTSFIQSMNCSLGEVYKYICQDMTSTIDPWYKGWKDSVRVKEYSVSVLRVRWAKNEYDPSIKAYPYFTYGEDELMEYPGFVYHCHILPHEQIMMMRPIMMKPSDSYLKMLQITTNDPSKCLRSTWLDMFSCINQHLKC